MNLHQTLGRWYVRFDWADPSHGFRIAIGRWPKGETLAKLGAYRMRMSDEYDEYDVPHPFADPDALTGNIATPAGAHSFEAIKEAHEDSPQAIEVPRWADAETGQYVDAAIGRAKNWVDQSRDGS